MKRLKLTAVIKSEVPKSHWRRVVEDLGGEIEELREREIPKDGFHEEYSWDALTDAGMQLLEGGWLIFKSIGKLLMWSVIVIFSGVKWMWKKGVGSKQKGSIFDGVKK